MWGDASASVSYSSGLKYIEVLNEPGISLSEINATLNNPIAMWKDGDIFYINGSLYSHDSLIYINSTDCLEVRINGNSGKTNQFYGLDDTDRFWIDDVILSSYNITGDTYQDGLGYSTLYNSHFNNVTLKYSTVEIIGAVGAITNISAYSCNQIAIKSDDLIVENVYMEDSRTISSHYAFKIYNSDNVTYRNINVNKTVLDTVSSSGVGIDNCTNSFGYNIRATNINDCLTTGSVGTGGYCYVVTHGSDAYAENIYLNGSRHSTFAPTGGLTRGTFKNIVVENSGHNGLDIHPAHDIYIENITIRNSHDINALITGGYHVSPSPSNITVNGLYLYEGGIQCDANTSDVTFINTTQYNGSVKVYDIWGEYGVKFINFTSSYGDGYTPTTDSFLLTEISTYNVQRGMVIDTYAYRMGRYLLNPFYTPAENINFINVGYGTLAYHNNMTLWYYPNIIVKNASGVVIPNATITFTEDTLNGWGEPQSTFRTDENGKLYDSGNRSNWAAFPDVYYNLAGTLTTSYTGYANATYGNVSNSSTLIDLSTSDYSSNPAALSGTEYVIILDVMTDGEGGDEPASDGGLSEYVSTDWNSLDTTHFTYYHNGDVSTDYVSVQNSTLILDPADSTTNSASVVVSGATKAYKMQTGIKYTFTGESGKYIDISIGNGSVVPRDSTNWYYTCLENAYTLRFNTIACDLYDKDRTTMIQGGIFNLAANTYMNLTMEYNETTDNLTISKDGVIYYTVENADLAYNDTTFLVSQGEYISGNGDTTVIDNMTVWEYSEGTYIPFNIVSSSGDTEADYGYTEYYSATGNKTITTGYLQVNSVTVDTQTNNETLFFSWTPDVEAGDYVVSINATDGTTWDNSTVFNVNVFKGTEGTIYAGRIWTHTWSAGSWVITQENATRSDEVITGVEVRP